MPLVNSRYQRLPIYTSNMKSLRRNNSSNPHASNVSSKIFVRSTKSGKVQKIVRELYLRQDIPCSSKLCTACLSYAPTDANGFGRILLSPALIADLLTDFSS